MSSTSTTGTSAERRRSPDRAERGWGATAGLVLLAWVLIGAVLLGWGWLLTHPLEGSIDPTDDDISRWFAGERSADLDPIAETGTFFGETIVGAGAFTVVGLLVSLVRRTWIPILMVAVLEAGIGGYYLVATHLITRDRPPVELLDAGLDPNASFPSGHVATALICSVGTLVLIFAYFRSVRWWFVWLLAVPVLAVLARLYQGAHHLSDVLTSVVYASVWLACVARLLLSKAAAALDPR